jgi:lipopolysaccharide/colanic/teichoic acid biosynthesis glycosyltransferase
MDIGGNTAAGDALPYRDGDGLLAYRAGRVAKRLLDLVLAGSVLIVAAPLFVLIAMAIRLDSRGPVFFRTQRVGRHGEVLRMLKFRKMRDGARGLGLTMAEDARFTRVGRFLASTKLDELPQLWHVVRGEMSLVGPRPESSEFVAYFDGQYEEILKARPGIVGLSQLAFAAESRILAADNPVDHYVGQILPQKVSLDLAYHRRWSVWLDLKIIWWSFVAVLFRRPVAVHRETTRMNVRRRGDGGRISRWMPIKRKAWREA